MRLLNAETFALEDFFGGGRIPQYAILSHTWDGDEVSHQDIADLDKARQKAGFQKIQHVCEQARVDGFQYAWVDTCCIDKNSSHELSEAINSMYRWYSDAAVCYVYLSDVPGYCPPMSDDTPLSPSSHRWFEVLEDSRWFLRGWTLQELIAPPSVFFFGQAWNCIGSLQQLMQMISSITNIQTDVLDHSRPLSDLSVARRLSWAAKRETTRIEDQAYSLFGILDVNMPLLYGEGPKAFLRLQEEIIRHSTDQSIFAWDAPSGFVESRELLLAPSPRCFLNGSLIRRKRLTTSESEFRMSNKGLEITLPIVQKQLQEDPSHPYVTLGILDCKYEGGSANVLAIVMKQHPFNIQGDRRAVELYVHGYNRTLENGGTQYGRIIQLDPRDAEGATPRALTITKDLQSQNYIQAFNTNKTSWFPIRFTGDSEHPVLETVYPEEYWSSTSQTMRLHVPQCSCGGIVVRLPDGKHALIAFGVYSSSPERLTPARRIYAISYIDPYCPIEPHLNWLTTRTSNSGVNAVALRLGNGKQRLVAQLWNGALTVSIENTEEARASRTSSIHSLSPPSSPMATFRRPSFGTPPRRDSVLQDDQSEWLERSPSEPLYRVHETSQCENCRDTRAKYLAGKQREKDERRRKYEENEAKKRSQEKQRKMVSNVKKASLGMTAIGVLSDVAEYVAI